MDKTILGKLKPLSPAEELETAIETMTFHLNISQNHQRRLQAILDKYSEIKEDELTADQVDELQSARMEQHQVAESITKLTKDINFAKHKLSVMTGAGAGINNNHSSSQSVSSGAGQDSQRKKIKLKYKKLAAKLRQSHEERMDFIKYNYNCLLEKPDDDKRKTWLAENQAEQNWQLQKFERDKRNIDEDEALELEELDLEQADEQHLDGHQTAIADGFKYPDHGQEVADHESVRNWQSHPVYGTGGDTRCQPDKDTIMIQIMQQQLNLMTKGSSSFGDKKLPDFSGNPCEWGNFKAAFDRTNDRFKFENSENLSRLQGSLKGEAREAVVHLMANVANVPKIMQILERRFGRPEYILDYLVEKVKSCSRPDPAKPKTMVDFGTAVENLIVNVCAYNEEDYMSNRQLVKDLVEKLPTSLRDQWYLYIYQDSNRKPNLKNFAKWLEVPVAVATLQLKPTVTTTIKSEERTTPRSRRQQGSINSTEGEEKPSKACVVCNAKNHSISSCWNLKKKSLDERWKLVKAARVCYYCLKEGHTIRNCKDAKECGQNGCDKKHHHLLHKDIKTPQSVEAPPQKKPEDDDRNMEVHKSCLSNEGDKNNASMGVIGVSMSIIKGTDGPLPIVPVRVRNSKGVMRNTYALLDSGATRTMIKKDLADFLKLEGTPIQYSYRTFSGSVVTENKARKVECQVGGKFRNAKMWNLRDVITVEDIGLTPYSINVDRAKEKWPHLKRYKGPSLNSVTPEIVIGGDHGYLLMHRELLFAKEEEPVGMRTVLGWILQGKLTDTNSIGTGCYVGGVCMDEVLHNLIKESFKFDEYVTRDGETCMSVEDKQALQMMETTTTQRPDGRWQTSLLWKNDEPFPSNGFKQAFKRLCNAEKRMQRDPAFALVYRNKIEEYLSKGYIRKLTQGEATEEPPKTRYISHFGVVNPNKPGKFRLVFDAAEKADEVSLNDRLLTGPDLLRSLPSVLMNFRVHQIVICGDIEDMFHRIYIVPEHRPSQRFLWRDGDSSRDPDVFEMKVMMFGSTSSPTCANFVKNKNADCFSKIFPNAVTSIKEDTYSDDLLSGAPSIQEAIQLRRQITEINEHGGFVMKKWTSNSQEVLDSIPAELRLNGPKQVSENGTMWQTERVLGLWWDSEKDEFTFQLKFNKVNPEILRGKVPTKREMCSLLMSMFDPLGFIGNYRIKGMILLQHVWRSGIDWDQNVPEELHEPWREWISDLNKIGDLRIPRLYCNTLSAAIIQLHTMVDASAEAFCAVCYLRIEWAGHVQIAFVASNVKVAPLKKKTIPRLELDAAVLGCKLAGKILRDLKVKICATYYWSDSSTVLSWIKSESARYKEYVANRVGRIQESTNAKDWYWIPTSENAADDGTRSLTPADLSSDSRWLRGPAFLRMPDKMWPKKRQSREEDLGVLAAAAGEEILEDAPGISLSSSEGCGLGAGQDLNSVLPKLDKFSSYYRLIRATAAVVAAASFWLDRIRGRKQVPPWTLTDREWTSNLKATQLLEAERRLIKLVQKDIGKLSKFRNLCPAYDQFGIIRVQGRIGNADCVNEETKSPILLPANNKFVELLIDHEHAKNAHTGRNTVYNSLRQKYWIENGRHAVRRAWTRCNFCRMKKAKPIVPRMGDLPSCRLKAYSPPFTYTGVDMFGPVEVTVGRRHEKRWGVVFTDLVTRAIYLDVAAGCSADDAMLVLSRFVDVRGLPRHIYSDNATNFVAIAKEVEKRSKFVGAEWHFIPAASPHMGGSWESMVKETKRVLYNLLKDKHPRDQVLMTALKAVEGIVNSRPLSFVSGDINDTESITPNHFLRGVGIASGEICEQAGTTTSVYFGEDVTDDKERWGKQWEKAQHLAKCFWERWTKNVLPDLLRRNKWTQEKDSVRVGDVVIMVDENKPRNTWSKAVVTKTYPGKDGIVRVVEVTTRNPETRSATVYKRAVAKICPTGIRCDLSADPGDASKSGGRNGKDI